MTRQRGVLAAVVLLAVVVVGAIALGGGDDGGGTDGADGTTAPVDESTIYVALGDSVSAGGGAPPYDGRIRACFQSTRAWPVVLHELDPSVAEPELLACGGAEVAQLVDAWPQRQQEAQIPTRPNEDVGLVTLTIGGNDTGLGIFLPFCVANDCSGVVDAPEYAERLALLAARLTGEVYPDLRLAFPNARLIHVGYARALPAAGEPTVACQWLDPAEQADAALVVSKLNDTIRAAAAGAVQDVEFVDVADALAGHELCTADPWVRASGADAFHPTAEGHEAIAAVVAEALGG